MEIKNEAWRKYTYVENGSNVVFSVDRVVRVLVRPSGTHRLETTDGRKFIVRAGWVAIEIGAAEWSE